MKRLLTLWLFCGITLAGWSQETFQILPDNPWQEEMDIVYDLYPSAPRGLLEAICYTHTRFHERDFSKSPESCIGLPYPRGPMGIMFDTSGYFNNVESQVYSLSGNGHRYVFQYPYTHQVMHYGFALFVALRQHNADTPNPKDWLPAIAELSAIPAQDPLNDFAAASELYAIYAFLDCKRAQEKYGFPDYRIDMEAIFGKDRLAVLSARKVIVSPSGARTTGGISWPGTVSAASPDYPAAVWDPTSCNFSSRSGTPISAVTIHTTQGSYSGAISWFKNCSSNVSAHYVIRSFDGQVTQMVLEDDKGWHVGSENPYTIGIEHEGYVDDPSWYTNAMYESSADLVKDIVGSGYGIDPLTTYYGTPTTGILVLPENCYRIKGHQHFPYQTHVDPGPNWDWDRYYRMINTASSPSLMTATSGNFYDSGGLFGSYSDQERSTWLIQPPGADTLMLDFTSWDVEAGYDFLWIFDGPDEHSTLIGKFSSTSPGIVTSTSGSLFLEFRSDCFTNRTGWEASWNTLSGPFVCEPPSGLKVSDSAGMSATISWDPIPGADSYVFRYRNSLDTSWTVLPVMDTSVFLSGLASSSRFYAQVQTLCGTSASSYSGLTFHTTYPTNETYTSCAGKLYDSGGLSANYRNSESWEITLSPPGADLVSISFASFDLESGYDFLRIYDGNSTAAPLLGTWSGTSSPGVITSSGGSLTIAFDSDGWTTNSGWDAEWTCSYDLAPLTNLDPLNDWYSDDFTASFSDTDNSGSGLAHSFYQVLEFDGIRWHGNEGNGWLYADFDSDDAFAEWTPVSGNAYRLYNRMHQTDTLQTNTNNYRPLSQDSSSVWLYQFDTRLWEQVASSNRRFGIHFFSDDGSLTNRGNSYLVWFRGDNQDVQIYKTVSDVLNLQTTDSLSLDPLEMYTIRITYDPGTGEIKVWKETDLVASWIDPSPLKSGSHVSLRTNEAHVDFDNIRTFRSRGTTANIRIGPASTEDCRYMSIDPFSEAGKVFSIVLDNADHWSNMDQEGFKIDWTVPTDPSPVSDGAAADIDTVFSLTDLEANWASAADGESDIRAYHVALGSSPGADDIVAWADNGLSTNIAYSGLSLVHDSVYYISVEAENGAGLRSAIISSDGQRAWMPIVGTLNESWDGRIYPNPAQSSFRIDPGSSIIRKVRVFDLRGSLTFDQAVSGSDEIRINTQNWTPGIYLVSIETNKGKIHFKRLLIKP